MHYGNASLVPPKSNQPALRLGEWCHDVAGKGLDETRQPGNGSWHPRLGHKAHDANHREAAIVDLGEEALGLLLGRCIARDAGGVVEREPLEVVPVEGEARELGVDTGLATPHVVLAVELTPKLEEADKADDLKTALCITQRERGVDLLGQSRRGILMIGDCNDDSRGGFVARSDAPRLGD